MAIATPLIIDVESSGLGRGSYPIEVGFATPSGETHCMIIRPCDDWQHWDDEAELLHGISRETLQRHGHEPIIVARQLNQWLGGETVYSDAWGNDSTWVALLFDSAGISQHFTLQSLRSLLTESQVECWHPVKEQLIAQSPHRRHRASSDALILQQTFCQTLTADRDHMSIGLT